MGLFEFSKTPGPLQATYQLLYLCVRAVIVESRSDEFDITLKRCAVLAVLACVLPMLVWWNSLGFWLDDLLFPAYRSQPIVAPIFIQGSARSGTTALHRLLAQDPQLTSMTTWEIVVAPSVTWRRLFQGLARVDRVCLCGLLARLLASCARRLAEATAVVHEVRVFDVEEDEWLMTHIGAAQLLAFFFPILDDLAPVVDWDRGSLPQETKQAILAFYQSCIRRHLYAHGAQTYVAKNPTFNKRMRWLQAAFPDARFVLTTRPPTETVPSLVSYIGAIWGVFCSPRARCPLARALTEMQPGDIDYPIDALGDWPENQRAVVTNETLRRSPAEVLQGLNKQFGLSLSTESVKRAAEASASAGKAPNLHRYSIEDTGMFQDEFQKYFASASARLQRLEAGQWK